MPLPHFTSYNRHIKLDIITPDLTNEERKYLIENILASETSCTSLRLSIKDYNKKMFSILMKLKEFNLVDYREKISYEPYHSGKKSSNIECIIHKNSKFILGDNGELIINFEEQYVYDEDKYLKIKKDKLRKKIINRLYNEK